MRKISLIISLIFGMLAAFNVLSSCTFGEPDVIVSTYPNYVYHYSRPVPPPPHPRNILVRPPKPLPEPIWRRPMVKPNPVPNWSRPPKPSYRPNPPYNKNRSFGNRRNK